MSNSLPAQFNLLPPEQKTEVLTGLRDALLDKLAHRTLYEYQRAPSDAIIESVINNQGKEFYIEFSRQSGKTELIAKTVFALSIWYYLLTGTTLTIGIFAPKYDQSQITFKRMKEAFEMSLAEMKNCGFTFSTFSTDTIILRSPHGKAAEIQCLTASKDTTIKGFTFGVIICEECIPFDTEILTDKGWLKIGKIVEEKIKCQVLSFNEYNNRLEWKQIDGYFKKKTKELMRIDYNGGHIFCTPNHRFLTQKGWKEAQDLNSLRIKTLDYGRKNNRQGNRTDNIGNITGRYLNRVSKFGFSPCTDLRDARVLSARLCSMESKRDKLCVQDANMDSQERGIRRNVSEICHRVQPILYEPILEFSEKWDKNNNTGVSGLANATWFGSLVYGRRKPRQTELLDKLQHPRVSIGGEHINTGLFCEQIWQGYACEGISCGQTIPSGMPSICINNQVLSRSQTVPSSKYGLQMEGTPKDDVCHLWKTIYPNEDKTSKHMFRNLPTKQAKKSVSKMLLQGEDVYDIRVKDNHNFFIRFKSGKPVLAHNCQDIADTKIKEDILPMGAATNATRVFIGTPALGTHYRYFYNGILKNHNCFIIDYLTAQKYNPNYAHYISEQKELIGEDSPEFQSQYELVWVLSASKFIDFNRLLALGKPYNRIKEKMDGYIVAGLDVAKSPDSSVLTIVELDGTQKRILDWLELHGENYEDQVAVIAEYLSHYKVQKVVVDEVGAGDPIVDLLTRRLRTTIDGFKWTAESHHDAFKTLWLEMDNGRVEYPASEEAKKTKEYKRFFEQFINLDKKYVGNLMKCHHPDGTGFHDDFVSSACLAIQALTPTKPFAFSFGTTIKKEEVKPR